MRYILQSFTWSTVRSFIIYGLLLCGICYTLFSPRLHLKIGNTFFGDVPVLYNVNLASFFFFLSSHPFVSKPPQFAYYQLARTEFIKGDLYRALDDATFELSLYPENMRTYYMLGLINGYLDKEEEAIKNFQTFIGWKPDTWAARNDKAWLEFRIGKIDDALKTIEPVIKQTDNAWVQNTYGVLLMNKKRYAEAKIAFQYAKVAAEKMTEKEWGNTYPGNDPRVYATGLKGMRLSINTNLKLLDTKK